jgi:hypothetical protein
MLLCAAGAILAQDTVPIPYDAKMAELSQNPAAEISVSKGWTVIQIAGQEPYSIWSFTPENHPAHPAFAKRTIIQDATGAWHVKTEMSCGASKNECDKLIKEYELLDQQMKAMISGDKGT